MVRSIAAALILVVCLRSSARAAPEPALVPPAPTQTTVSDADAVAPVEVAPVPVGPAKLVEEPRSTSSRSRKIRAVAALAGIYAVFSAWTYFAWYQKPIHEFHIDDDPSDGRLFRWLGVNTYAGGSDKFGHAWSTMGLARVGTELLHQWGGYSKLEASIIGASLSEALFLAVEVVDGYHYTFSSGDLTFNTLGALLALAQSNYPRVDDLVDFRVEYVPSKAYRDLAAEGDVDYAEDYSGQTYYLALHLGGIPQLREAKYGLWSQFVDVAVGWKTRGYKPDPPWQVPDEMPDYDMKQTMFLGVTLNLQGVFDYVLGDGRAPLARKLAHGAFELVSIPYTSLPVLENSRVPTEPIGEGGSPPE